jgi:uncharacterized membrane protein
MSLRSPKERLIQAVCYELGGLVIAVPFYHFVVGGGTQESLLLMVALSVAVLFWSPLHNLVFDVVEHRRTGRVASDRPHRWRMVHATSHEVTTILVTLPVLVFIGGHGWWGGLAVDLALTVIYTVYAYGFNLLFDWLRPVGVEVLT